MRLEPEMTMIARSGIPERASSPSFSTLADRYSHTWTPYVRENTNFASARWIHQMTSAENFTSMDSSANNLRHSDHSKGFSDMPSENPQPHGVMASIPSRSQRLYKISLIPRIFFQTSIILFNTQLHFIQASQLQPICLLPFILSPK